MFRKHNNGVIIAIKITPKANRNEIIGEQNGELRIRITAVPEKGQANRALVFFMAKTLKVSKSQVMLIQGETSRHKQIFVSDISLAEVTDILEIDIAEN